MTTLLHATSRARGCLLDAPTKVSGSDRPCGNRCFRNRPSRIRAGPVGVGLSAASCGRRRTLSHGRSNVRSALTTDLLHEAISLELSRRQRSARSAGQRTSRPRGFGESRLRRLRADRARRESCRTAHEVCRSACRQSAPAPSQATQRHLRGPTSRQLRPHGARLI